MPTPNECQSIKEIRTEIDRIDQQIIQLIGERFEYVMKIVDYKSNAEEVKAQPRYNEIMEIRRKWGAENGLNPDVIEDIYKTLVHYFIDEQMKILHSRISNK